MRDDLLRFGTTVMNELGEATVILFNVGLAGADLLPREPERAEIEGHLALFRQLVFGARVLRNKKCRRRRCRQ